MPTQEERLAALEYAFEAFQREVGKSMRELNENATITLGLVQQLIHESKYWSLISMRVDHIETKLNAHTAMLKEHTSVLNDHTATLTKHTAILSEHTATLNEHTAILNEHTATLNEHTVRLDRVETKLDEHTARFDRLEGLLGQVLERLPKSS